jgi:hypothetical protein
MKYAAALVTALLMLGACNSNRGPSVPPTDEQQGIERICSIVDLETGPVEVCICKTATEASTCPN